MRRAGPAAGATRGIVLLHGRGGSAADILVLMDHAGVSDVAAIAPEAPGATWWPSSFLAAHSLIEPHVHKGVAAVTKAIATLQADGIPRNAIWLGGFSQGACLALESFARAGDGLAGVFAFSGGLVGTTDTGGPEEDALYGHAPKRFDYPGRREQARVWLSVHARDPHIPLKRAEDSATVLRAMGATVTTTTYPGTGHSVMREDLAQMRLWLNV